MLPVLVVTTVYTFLGRGWEGPSRSRLDGIGMQDAPRTDIVRKGKI